MKYLIKATGALVLGAFLSSCGQSKQEVYRQPAVKRFAMVTSLHPDQVAFYKDLHPHPWPGVTKTISDCNISNYSIHLKKTAEQYLLFSYFEYSGQDFEADMKKMAADTITQRWWKLTAPTQTLLPDAAAKGQIWSNMEEVFFTP